MDGGTTGGAGRHLKIATGTRKAREREVIVVIETEVVLPRNQRNIVRRKRRKSTRSVTRLSRVGDRMELQFAYGNQELN